MTLTRQQENSSLPAGTVLSEISLLRLDCVPAIGDRP
jgi:hypothetical protein